jgi:hypothetical protein
VFAATYLFNPSDENLPGTLPQVLTLNLEGEVLPIPEPSSLFLTGTGMLLGMIGIGRLRQRAWTI